MTAKELIEKLKQYPEDMEVSYEYEGYFVRITDTSISFNENEDKNIIELL